MTKKYVFKGIVQGIGFRPAALRLALENGITGTVCNSGGYVTLTASGTQKALDAYIRCLVALFSVKSYTETHIPQQTFDSFKIIHSSSDNSVPFLTPDLATCADCERELKDKNNRRYNHPFISCVNCGPRYTIQKSIPYDRENTAMEIFPMCPECKEEYTTPSDRRCHAQTIACNQCGPEISMSIEQCAKLLKDGKAIAVKGIGGYHLCAWAKDENAVNSLRKIKGRETKPFAVMFSSSEEISEYCFVSDVEEEALTSPARPIVLLKKKKDFPNAVSAGSEFTGAFLPCNPIQIMLLEKISPLVMTSANLSGAPIITDDKDAASLGVPVLAHNREILTPIDDSVCHVIDGKVRWIRRARGCVPLAVDIGVCAKRTTFCAGGDLKSVFGFHTGNYVYLSQPFGDLEDADCFDAYCRNIKRFSALHSFSAEKTVTDLHPNYYSASLYPSGIKIQHHKAHSASVIAEHKLHGEVLCFAFDGTGYGDDGAIWGSEVFRFNGKEFTRLEHLDYTLMPGSDETAKDAELCLSCYTGTNELIEKAKAAGINMVKCSSMGRLFDAVSALLGICGKNTYEGECAEKLEACAALSKNPCKFTPSLSPKEIIEEISKSDAPVQDRALGFHYMLAELILKIAKKYSVRQIALSGGVFNNRILTERALALLRENGFCPYINEQVPTGDGGIALGQAYIAALEEK